MPLTEQRPDQATAQEQYTWNLADLYPDIAAWRADKARVAGAVPQVRAFAGRLGASPQSLADALETLMRLDRELTRLYVYAGMLSDEDTRRSEPQGMQQEMQQLHAEFSAHASYIQPEILRVGGATIETFIRDERATTKTTRLVDVWLPIHAMMEDEVWESLQLLVPELTQVRLLLSVYSCG